jgi:hypothetical protein
MPERTTISTPQQQAPAAHAPAQGNALRMQDPVFIQRKCADCEQEEEVQRKPPLYKKRKPAAAVAPALQ